MCNVACKWQLIYVLTCSCLFQSDALTTCMQKHMCAVAAYSVNNMVCSTLRVSVRVKASFSVPWLVVEERLGTRERSHFRNFVSTISWDHWSRFSTDLLYNCTITSYSLIYINNISSLKELSTSWTSDHVWSDRKSDHELSTEVLIVSNKERATKHWLISDQIRWLKGKQNYVRCLLAVFNTESCISEAKLTFKSLRKGSTKCAKDVWPPLEQMTSQMKTRAETGSRNIVVIEEIESSNPKTFNSPKLPRNQSIMSVANSTIRTCRGLVADFPETSCRLSFLFLMLNSP